MDRNRSRSTSIRRRKPSAGLSGRIFQAMARLKTLRSISPARLARIGVGFGGFSGSRRLALGFFFAGRDRPCAIRFWHRHPDCRFAYTPKSRMEFWQAKFDGNVARDQRRKNDLRAAGWTPVVIWECETRDPDRLAGIIRDRVMQSPVPTPDQ